MFNLDIEKSKAIGLKRGLNLYISSVISKKSDGQYEITSYAHLFDSCKQDWYTVASILEDLLGTISKENPEITQAFLRSDEAGCYHNNLLLAAIRDVSKRCKIKISTYHFSEPQYGKDVCDRILCPLKSSIRRYCNEGNDILSAKNMREALQKCPVKGTTVSVRSYQEKSTDETEANELHTNILNRVAQKHSNPWKS